MCFLDPVQRCILDVVSVMHLDFGHMVVDLRSLILLYGILRFLLRFMGVGLRFSKCLVAILQLDLARYDIGHTRSCCRIQALLCFPRVLLGLDPGFCFRFGCQCFIVEF